MSDVLGNALSDIGSGIEQADPAAAQLVRSQDLGSALKNAVGLVGNSVAQLPGEAINFSDIGQAASAAAAFRPNITPTERALALAGVGLGVVGGAAAWGAAHGTLSDIFSTHDEAGMIRLPGATDHMAPALNTAKGDSMLSASDDPYTLAQAMSTSSAPQHQMAVAGFVNGLGNRLGSIDSWARQAQDQQPGVAGPRRAGFVLSQFQNLIDQKLAGPSLQPYVDTYKALQADAPGLLKTAAGQQKVQALQDFLYRLSDSTVDWVPHPAWQVDPSWKLSAVHETADQSIGFDFQQPQMPTWEQLTDPAQSNQKRGNGFRSMGTINRERALPLLNHPALVPQFSSNFDRVLQLANDDDWRSGTGMSKADRLAKGPDPTQTWYGRANAQAQQIGDQTGLDRARAAAVISLTSPGQDWDSNVDKAVQLIKGIQSGQERPDLNRMGWQISQMQYDKAKLLIDGNASPLDTFVNNPKAPERAQKTLNFWYGIEHPGSGADTTVDRQMAGALYGFDVGDTTPPLDRPANYEAMASAIQNVAGRWGLLPNEAQAVAWEAWKRLKTEWGGRWGSPKGPLVLDRTILDRLVGRDPTLWSVVRQMPKDNLAPAVAGGSVPDAGGGFKLINSGGGVRVEGLVSDRLRAEGRLLYPAGDPAEDNPGTVPWAPVTPRAVTSFPDHLKTLVGAAGDQPQVGEVFADPSASTHPSIIPGSHLLVKAAADDAGALDAYKAHLRDRLGVDMRQVASVNGPVRYEASGPGTVPDNAFAEVGPQKFANAISAARDVVKSNGRKVGETVYQYPTMGKEGYASMRTFLSPDGKTGYAIKSDGDFVSVFNVGAKGNGENAIKHALTRGATKLDAFDEGGRLPDLYGKYGFQETGRDKWDDQYAPPGWQGGKPDVVYMAREGDGYKSTPTPMRSLMVHLGDSPDPHLVQAAWNAVGQVSAETGKHLDPVFYGGASGPAGTTKVAEHLFTSKAGTMVTRTQAMDAASPNSAPAWVPSEEADGYPAGVSRLHQAAAEPVYTSVKGPKGETLGAVADNSVRVQFTHLAPVGKSQGVDLTEDITKSKLYGHRPKFMSVYVPGGAQLPAVSFGIDGVEQADAGLQSLRPAAGTTVHLELGRTVKMTDAPTELVARQAVGVLRRLGVAAPIKLPSFETTSIQPAAPGVAL